MASILLFVKILKVLNFTYRLEKRQLKSNCIRFSMLLSRTSIKHRNADVKFALSMQLSPVYLTLQGRAPEGTGRSADHNHNIFLMKNGLSFF